MIPLERVILTENLWEKTVDSTDPDIETAVNQQNQSNRSGTC